MADVPSKATGNTLTAVEFNEANDELNNAIESTGQTLSTSDLFQTSKTIANYVGSGSFYNDTGVANAYICTLIASKQGITSYALGTSVKFIATNINTGSSTVNVNALGVKNIKDSSGNNLIPGEIQNGKIIELIYDGTNFVLFNNSISGDEFSTGDRKETYKTVADSGWVIMDDGTIGSPGSVATTRANSDTESLYILLWNNCENAQCPVSGGRGASGSADFAANKTLNLPLVLGRAAAASGTGLGLTARSLGETVGDETHQLTIAELAAHTHTYDQPVSVSGRDNGGDTVFPPSATVTGSTGDDVPHNNMQPTSFVNYMIKL
jgi:hypothetical protein